LTKGTGYCANQRGRMSPHDARPAELTTGSLLAERFELLALAGAGGMGRVYRAHDRVTGNVIAVKILPAEGDVSRFTREANVLASLDHPGVVKYLEHGRGSDGSHYLVMEWLTGQDLNDFLIRRRMSVTEALVLARRAADALGAAHRRGVVHRDLKPGNLFLVDGDPERVKIVDFGLARMQRDHGMTLTVPGQVIGTPAYMAPEQVRGEPVDGRADVYGLGAVLFRCLTGRAPFSGAHRVAILAKVVLESAPRVSELAAQVPAALDDLIASMLAKQPSDRPADGAAVVEALSVIEAGAPGRGAVPAVTSREERVACVVMCLGATSNDLTLPSKVFDSLEETLRHAVEDRGGSVAVLSRGTWLVTIRSAASPAEQAARAARCALAIAEIRPGSPVIAATGRVVVAGDLQVGEVIDRATSRLLDQRDQGEAPGVIVDAATAELIEGHFDVRGDGAWRRLVSEHDSAAAVRTLLGRPAPYVGRTHELGLLASTLEACADEPCARAVLITAQPGLGKSRLVSEFLRRSIAPRADVELLFARADSARAGSPFGTAARLIERAAGVGASDSAAARIERVRALVQRSVPRRDADRVAEFLGEISGAFVPEAQASARLAAARADTSVMADAVREAWVDWMRGLATHKTVLLVLEDLHWADRPTVRLVDAALDELTEQPLMLLASARPEVSVTFPDLWRERGLAELSLGPLAPRAAERMAREALGSAADDATVRAVVQRAAGHPFHLEELVRAVASGRGPEALPDSVLGMIQARFDLLSSSQRRALRAASVFGETFWSAGVSSLTGEEAPGSVGALLGQLSAQEIVVRHATSRLNGQLEYGFRHALVRDAAYAMLTREDRTLSHRRAGEWLERAGETDPALLAEHFERGGAPARALAFFVRAAERALESNDLEHALGHVEHALTCGPDETTRAELGAIESEATYWRGDLERAAERAVSAAGILEPGTRRWLAAVSVAIGAFGQRGRNEEVAAWLERAARVSTPASERGEHAVTLCRGLTQLYWAHYRGDLGGVRARFDELVGAAEGFEPYHAGWVRRVRGESAWLHSGDVDRCLRELGASSTAFEDAHALRQLAMTRLNLASLAGWAGRLDEARSLAEHAGRVAERRGFGFIVNYAHAVTGLLLVYAGELAEPILRDALGGLSNSPRLAFLCHVLLGFDLLRRGEAGAAEQHARAAGALEVASDLGAARHALTSGTRLAQGDVEQALVEARSAVELGRGCTDLELTYGLAETALAEALAATGDRDAARDAALPAYRRLQSVAATIASDEQRARFWSRRLPNDRLRALAE
jgi:eukaryotic-like serine/threonine-protein kinase